MQAARLAAKRNPAIRLLLVGDGVEWHALRAMADQKPNGAVRIMAGIPREAVADLFMAADVLVVHLADRPLYALTIPSKTQFYLAMGKPILAGLRGEAAGLIEDAGAGIVVPPEQVGAMADAMIELAGMGASERARMGAQGRDYYQRHLSRDCGMASTVALIEETISAR